MHPLDWRLEKKHSFWVQQNHNVLQQSASSGLVLWHGTFYTVCCAMYHLHSGKHTQLNTVQQCILWIGSPKWQESDHSSSSHHCLRWRHSANDTSEPIQCKIRIKGIKMQKYGESKCKRCKALLLCLLVEIQTKEKDAKKTLKSENIYSNLFNL